MSLVALAEHLSYLSVAMLAIALYYAVKALALLLTFVVGIYTKDTERRKTCLKLARMIAKGWAWPPRPPGG
jgi:hypothetical protein